MNEIRTGVYVCWCGSNIAKVVDVEKVAAYIGTLPNVAVSKSYKYMCSDPGQEMLIHDIKEHRLDRIVIAACSPRIHELTFRKALEKAGLNPYMLQMANIREQDSWVHIDKDKATEKAKTLISAAVKRVGYHEALDKRYVEINPATLIIGGGISGLAAALEIAGSGNQVYLIEEKMKLGGRLNDIHLTYPYFSKGRELVKSYINKVAHSKNIQVFTNTILNEIVGYVGNFSTTIHFLGKEIELKFGNIIVATGLKEFNAEAVQEYGYGKLSGVVTATGFEKMLLDGNIRTSGGKIPERFTVIHCVGSRNEKYHNYCSRTCCATALKYENQIRMLYPRAQIVDIYSDMRSYGKGCEELYAATSQQNVLFLMFDQDKDLPKISKNGSDKLYIEFREKLSGEYIQVATDMVILMTAQEAQRNAKQTAHLTGTSLDSNGFLIEKHPKLDPVATTTAGVYIIGSCQAPKSIDESVNQAKAASARILSTIAKKVEEVEVTTSAVNEDICCGCKTCVKVCPFGAIRFQEEKNVSGVNEILCKGCGTCASACPTGAIKCKHFTDQQIISQIEGLLETELNIN